MKTCPYTRLALGLALAGFSGLTYAAGFALIEQNASGLGNAYAGQAASAQDASTIFFNPAGMTWLPDRQLVAAGHLVKPQAAFSGSSTLGGGDDVAYAHLFVKDARIDKAESGVTLTGTVDASVDILSAQFTHSI